MCKFWKIHDLTYKNKHTSVFWLQVLYFVVMKRSVVVSIIYGKTVELLDTYALHK
jgi:hypothetical protein